MANAFTTPSFAVINPEDPSALQDQLNAPRNRNRRSSATGAPWFAGFDWREQSGTSFSERILRAVASGPSDGCFARHGDVTLETVTLARELGLEISCWTVNEPAGMSRLSDLGVDAILTDHPDRLAQVPHR